MAVDGAFCFGDTATPFHTSVVDAVQVAEVDLEPYLEPVRDGALRHALEYGVAFLHETQAPAEQEVVNTLFASGAIQARSALPTYLRGTRRVFALRQTEYGRAW